MKSAGPVVQTAEFVGAHTGARFRIVSEPAARAVQGTVVFVHAFAEEMNKSRRMAARMARLLAADGWRVVQRDLFGCGDSAGEFGEAAWSDWLNDVEDEVRNANASLPVWLWCHRAGALLAAPALAARPDANLLLWQPALSGAQHLQQFLRLHSGARIVGSSGLEGGVSPIQRLRSGAAVEIGGYELNPLLAQGMEKASFEPPPGFCGRVAWFEVSAEAASEMPALTAQAIERLTERGIEVAQETVVGPPFWRTIEIEDCEALIERTRAIVTEWSEVPAPRPSERGTSTAGVAARRVHS